jgi:hypothetical protein
MLKGIGIAFTLVALVMPIGVSIAGQIQYPLFNAIAAMIRVYHNYPILILIQLAFVGLGIVLLVIGTVTEK